MAKPNKLPIKRPILAVSIHEAKPNKLFSEEQRAAVRFLRYNQTLPCEECGRRRKVMWTMLCEFYAHSMGQFSVTKSGKKHTPLTAVCGDHLLAPAFPIETEADNA